MRPSHSIGEDGLTAVRISDAEASESIIVSKAGRNCSLLTLVRFVIELRPDINSTYTQA